MFQACFLHMHLLFISTLPLIHSESDSLSPLFPSFIESFRISDCNFNRTCANFQPIRFASIRFDSLRFASIRFEAEAKKRRTGEGLGVQHVALKDDATRLRPAAFPAFPAFPGFPGFRVPGFVPWFRSFDDCLDCLDSSLTFHVPKALLFK